MLKKERQRVANRDSAPRSARNRTNGHSSFQESDRYAGVPPDRPSSDTHVQQSSQQPSSLLDKDDRMKTKICKFLLVSPKNLYFAALLWVADDFYELVLCSVLKDHLY